MPIPTDRLLLDIAEGTAAAIGDDFFELLVRYLAQSLEVRAALLTECTDPTLTRVRSLAFFVDGGFAQGIEYELAGTPCQLVIDGSECYIPTDLTQRFPKEEGFDSYLAVPVFGVAHEVLGHLAVLDDAPMAGGDRHFPVLRIFAARAGAELERLRAEQALRVALSELERLKNRLQQENSYLQEEIARGHNFRTIIGTSPALAQALGRAEQVAPTDATVLILGETGTGKELVARAIHDRSARKDRPLVKVNCAALPAALIESELFGHEKGAFTGAHTRRIGRFELADGGTLFLDEVGELPLELQAKLLRILQEGEFERLGGSASRRVDVRVIAATNRDLAAAVQEGSFRADLFYRLNVVPIRVPPLRERREDVPDLVRSFVARFARKTGRPINRIPAAVMEQLQAYAWPGNVRELQNVIERAVVLAPDDTLLLDEAFSASARTGHPSPPTPSAPDLTPGLTLDELQRRYIRRVLADTGGKIAGRDGAAERLGLNPNTLRSRMQRLGIGRQGESP